MFFDNWINKNTLCLSKHVGKSRTILQNTMILFLIGMRKMFQKQSWKGQSQGDNSKF